MPMLSTPTKLVNRLHEHLTDLISYVDSVCDNYIDKGCEKCPFKKTRFEDKYECRFSKMPVSELNKYTVTMTEIIEVLEEYENAHT